MRVNRRCSGSNPRTPKAVERTDMAPRSADSAIDLGNVPSSALEAVLTKLDLPDLFRVGRASVGLHRHVLAHFEGRVRSAAVAVGVPEPTLAVGATVERGRLCSSSTALRQLLNLYGTDLLAAHDLETSFQALEAECDRLRAALPPSPASIRGARVAVRFGATGSLMLLGTLLGLIASPATIPILVAKLLTAVATPSVFLSSLGVSEAADKWAAQRNTPSIRGLIDRAGELESILHSGRAAREKGITEAARLLGVSCRALRGLRDRPAVSEDACRLAPDGSS